MQLFNLRRIMVLSLVLLSLMSFASAYEYLTVEIPATLNVVTTNYANIALIKGDDTWQGPGGANPIYVGYYENQYFRIHFGPWGARYKVTYSSAFKIHNYDDETWDFRFDTGSLGDFSGILKRIAVSTDGGSTYTTIWTPASGQYSSTFSLDPDGEAIILLEIEIPAGQDAGSVTGTLILQGKEADATEFTPP